MIHARSRRASLSASAFCVNGAAGEAGDGFPDITDAGLANSAATIAFAFAVVPTSIARSKLPK